MNHRDKVKATTNALVTIARFREPADAARAKSSLDSAGIESALENVRLSVQPEDAYRAYDAVDPKLPVVEEAYEGPRPPLVCDVCGSATVVTTSRLPIFMAISLIAVGMGVAVQLTELAFFAIAASGMHFLIADRHRCTTCGETMP